MDGGQDTHSPFLCRKAVILYVGHGGQENEYTRKGNLGCVYQFRRRGCSTVPAQPSSVGAPDQIRIGDLSLSGRALFPSELRGQYVGADGLAFASEPSASPFTHQLYPTRPLVAQYVVVEFL